MAWLPDSDLCSEISKCLYWLSFQVVQAQLLCSQPGLFVLMLIPSAGEDHLHHTWGFSSSEKDINEKVHLFLHPPLKSHMSPSSGCLFACGTQTWEILLFTHPISQQGQRFSNIVCLREVHLILANLTHVRSPTEIVLKHTLRYQLSYRSYSTHPTGALQHLWLLTSLWQSESWASSTHKHILFVFWTPMH